MRRFEEMNPVTVAAYHLSVLGLTMFTMNPLTISLSLAFSVLNAAFFGAVKLRGHIFSLILFAIAVLINPLAVHNGTTVLFYLNDSPITLEAVLYGFTAAGMITASLYWLRCITSALSTDKVIYLLGRLSPKLALLLSMSIRFIGLLKQRWRKIQDSQKALGLYNDSNLIDGVKGRARVLSVLITWTLENGIITAESMESRGYGTSRRRSYSRYGFGLFDGIIILITAALTALSGAGAYNSTVVFYPDLKMELATPWGIAGAAAFALLCAVPLIINIKEAIKWRCLILKA